MLDDADRLTRRAGAVDRHDDELTGRLELLGIGQIIQGHGGDAPPLAGGDGLSCHTGPIGAPGLYFDKGDFPTAFRDDVDFSKPGAVACGRNDEPVAGQSLHGQAFAEFSQ